MAARRRVFVSAALLGAWPASTLVAQVPRGVSPRLAAAVGRDTTVLVWILARPHADLAALAAEVSAQGGRTRTTSQFLHGVSALVPGTALATLSRMADVARVQAVGAYYRKEPRERGRARAGSPSSPMLPLSHAPTLLAPPDTTYGSDGWAFRQLNVPAVHALGARGAGVRIALLDAGFNTLHPLMAGAHVVAQKDFVYGDSVVRDQPGEAQGEMAHGTGTWSLLAAQRPGRLYGVAPQADFLLAKTEYTPTETRIEEDHWVAAIEWAIANGAQIISSSLGYLSFDNGFTYTPAQLNGDVAVTTIAADSAAARGVLVVVAVGNEGVDAAGRYAASSMDTPADADSVVAVGATDSLGRTASFSSHGPTADGRIKPEVAAPGVFLDVAAMDSGLARVSGTSFATPLIAGIAALAQSGRPGHPAADLRRGLLQAASQALTPDNSFGYGIPDALKLFAFPSGVALTGPPPGPLSTVTPTFTWDAGTRPPGTGSNTYRLRVWRDTALTTLVLDTTVASSSLTMPAGVHTGSRLFWRLTASSTLGVAESTAVRGGATVPPWATLLTLAEPQGATIRDSLPRFAWHVPAANTPPGPFAYDFDVYPASRTPAQAVASGRGLVDTTFQVTVPLEKNLPFRWRVVVHLGADSEVVVSPGTFLVVDQSLPAATLLFQNFPNPFPNLAVGLPFTCFWFDVAQPGDVRLEVFDLRGRLIKRLAPGPATPLQLAAGRYGRPTGDAPGTCDPRFTWDGRDDEGRLVRAGVYVYRLTAPGFQDSRRLVFAGAP